jgi:ornithine cyclodeaminase/alanine dehydrogenase-like protein (mu-crystallin family)
VDQKVEFLFLSQEEMIEAGVLDMYRCVEAMEKTFKLIGEEDYLMGGPSGNQHGLRLWFPKEPKGPRMPVDAPDRRFMALIGYLGGDFHVCGAKWYGSNTENPRKYGLPRSVLLVVLNDPETGAPLAIMDGTLISAVRTGAIVGLGAKYLINATAEVAAIIGAGVINRTSLMALAVGMPNLKKVKVFNINYEKAVTFSKEMAEDLQLDVRPVETMEEAIRDADAVSAATSRQPPSYKTEWFKPGAFFGLSSETHLADDLWLHSRIVADNWPMHIHWREETLKAPEEIRKMPIHQRLHDLILEGRMKDEDIVELGHVIAGSTPGRENEEQRIILATGGMSLEDVAWGHTVYKQALAKGLGRQLKLWDKPYWY